MDDPLLTEAHQLVERLRAKGCRLVLAESCTGGLVAAQLTRVAGVSQWWCGSAVTYREATKVSWLGVAPATIRQHTVVSEPVAREMVAGVLRQTPEADLAAAITGHLGPDAPAGQDGCVFIAVSTRAGGEVFEHHLRSDGRESRQREAAKLMFRELIRFLDA